MKRLRIAAALLWTAAASWTAVIALSATAVAAPATPIVGAYSYISAGQQITALHTYASAHSKLVVAYEPTSYTVQRGDTLSSIAKKEYGKASRWPALWWKNKSKIKDPNSIRVGQQLQLTSYRNPSPAVTAAAERAAAPVVTVAASRSYNAPVAAPARSDASGPWPGGAFGECVVERESGGNPNVMNASGHYGLYQFSESTWIEYGGSAADFGNASVVEQERVFMNAMAAGGESNWAPYDGC